MEKRMLDTIFVEAEKPTALRTQEEFQLAVYNASQRRVHDLEHVRLDLSFDFEKEAVIGKAFLNLKPFFHPMRYVTLDAKGFKWSFVGFSGQTQQLQYVYDDNQITIDLGKSFSKNERYTLELHYIANPTASGGSAAITSNQGLFFINPRGEDVDKPTQIWTQGETSWNSRWFPVIDSPNERCTQEMYLTVPGKFKTLSNGILVSEEQQPDGTRTDYWRMDKPHAPYLFMLAVGDFAVVKDTWQDKEVSYYVEPAYAPSARAIFQHTPEMLEFFSTKLGVPFPWSKYAQVVVRDYVSGAMENTTAVVFGDFVQKHSRELIDNSNDKIIAHELFHHWFGDLVTCESWANLTMNEGFANYSEYLWFEHKYGRDAADFHLYEEWQGYLATAPNDMHPLIHFGYADEEDMFDAHSYNKGGAVLHMLRNYLGDEVFFIGLNRYLTEFAFRTVEAHQLRLTFEEVSGEDLNWFFNQWYFSKGHPELDIQYGYDANTKEAVMRIEQLQNPDRNPPIFELPAQLSIYVAGTTEKHPVRLNQRVQTFRFKVDQQPDLIQFDSDRILLAEVKDNKSERELAFQFKHAPRFMDRFEALSSLLESESDLCSEILPIAVKDSFWIIRSMAIESASEKNMPNLVGLLQNMAETDVHSQVRQGALMKLGELNERQALEAAKKVLAQDSSYSVIGVALELLHQADPKAGLEYAAKLENEKSEDILVSISSIYKENPSVTYLPFFERNFRLLNAFNAITFIENYQELTFKLGEPHAEQAIQKLRTMALDAAQSPWRRLGATKSLNDFRNIYRAQGNQAKQAVDKTAFEKKVTEISRMIEEVKTFESNQELKSIYEQLELIPKN